MPQLSLQQIRILKTEPWTTLVDSHPIGYPLLSYPALWEFRSPDVVALGHPPRCSQCLRIPTIPSPQANRETKHLQKQHQHYTSSFDYMSRICRAEAEWPRVEWSYSGMEGIWQQNGNNLGLSSCAVPRSTVAYMITYFRRTELLPGVSERNSID